jgi:hypothetical protein
MSNNEPKDVPQGTDPKRVAFGEMRKTMIEGGDHSLSGLPLEFKPDEKVLAQDPKLFANTTPREPFAKREQEKRDAQKGNGGVGGPG